MTMQRRHFLPTLLALGIPLKDSPTDWIYRPGASLEPFLDTYPGDARVTRWVLADAPPGTFAEANARAFEAEARRRGKIFLHAP
jgi:hypothetical protein